MKEGQTKPDKLGDLRQRAEEALRGRPVDTSELSPEETQRLLHELQVHQVELEMQNNELRRTQQELEASREKYFDLYDLAPVGYFTISEKGLILEANLTSTTMLGVERGNLIKQPLTRFIVSEDQDIYYLHRKQLFETQAPQVCELRMVRKDGSQFWARIEATVARDSENDTPVWRATVSDVTERVRAEEERERLILELQDALAQVRTLSGLIPICASCKKIRDDEGFWNQLEAYIQEHSEAEFTHSICPECAKKLYPELYQG
jgi:PAS domain S-box-containing protein